jgi:hypothetical protein
VSRKDFIPHPNCTLASGACFHEGRCAGGCTHIIRRDPKVEILGWKCPVCGKGNAPFQKLCANSACGIDFSKGATA